MILITESIGLGTSKIRPISVGLKGERKDIRVTSQIT